MPIEPEIEEKFRELVGHAIRNQVEEIARVIAEAGEKGTGRFLGLAVQSSAYITIHVSEGWPKDANLRGVARVASESAARLPITVDEIHAYLSRFVFGNEQLEVVFPEAEKQALIPLYTLANQLVAFKPPLGKGWNAWLDVIEEALETAEKIAPLAAPAVAYMHLKK
jgi:hypothetical protein